MENENDQTISLGAHREIIRYTHENALSEGRRGRVSLWALLLAIVGAGLIGALLGTGSAMDAAKLQAARAAALDQQRVTRIIQLQSQLDQVRLQIDAHAEHAPDNPGESLLLNGIGAALGIPPGIAKIAGQALSSMANTAQANIARSNKAVQDVRSVMQLRVIETLMQGCGTHDNADCVLSRMCESRQADPEMRIEADSCGDSVDCWRKVLTECGN